MKRYLMSGLKKKRGWLAFLNREERQKETNKQTDRQRNIKEENNKQNWWKNRRKLNRNKTD